MGYKDYDEFDFISDDFFVSWVKRPDAETINFWENWLEKNPEKKDCVQRARKLIESIHFESKLPSAEDKEEVLENLLSRLDYPVIKSVPENIPTSKFIYQDKRWKIAAIIILLIVSTVFFLSDKMVMENTYEAAQAKHTQMIIKHNPAGKKSKLRLPDGSSVHLNSESKISFPKVFSKDKRMVVLEGEAYFEVSENKAVPFIVKTYDVTTEAIGTSFNVKTKGDGENIEISLIEGKVRVKDLSNLEASLLAPSEQIIWNEREQKLTKNRFDKEEITAWTKNILILKNANFEEVTESLSKWYGVRFVIKNRPTSFDDYNGTFKETSLEEILENLSFTSDIKYEIKNDIVFIH